MATRPGDGAAAGVLAVAASVAALGGKSLQPIKRPVATPRPAGGPPSAVQVEADVTRRAVRLTEQRRQLAAESRRLRGDR